MPILDNENIVHVIEDDIEYIQCRRLLEYSDRLVHAYTIRKHETNFNRNLLDEKTIKNNYKKLCDSLNIDYNNLIRPKQSHTDVVECVYDEESIYTDVDGLCTNKKDINLSLVYADCIPILFFDPVKNVVANIHSGWKGTVKRIASKAIVKMKEEYGSRPEEIICFIGPSICKKHFSVHEDVKDIFYNEFKSDLIIGDVIEKSNIECGKQKYEIDTININRILLEKEGLLPENIIESNLCTVCKSDYFHSYRVDADLSGRNTAIIGLV